MRQTKTAFAMRFLLLLSCVAVMMIGGTMGALLIWAGSNQDHLGTYLLLGAGAAVLILIVEAPKLERGL